MIVFVDDGDSECLKQRIDLGFVTCNECPARLDFEFFRELLQSFGSVDSRIDADGNQLHFESAGTGFLLHFAKSRGQRRTKRGARGEYEVDRNTPAFDQVVVEVELFPVLIEYASVWNFRRTERITFGFWN